MRILIAVLATACALGVAAGVTAADAKAASGVQFGIQDDAWLEFGPGRLADRVARLDRLGLDVVRVTSTGTAPSHSRPGTSGAAPTGCCGRFAPRASGRS